MKCLYDYSYETLRNLGQIKEVGVILAEGRGFIRRAVTIWLASSSVNQQVLRNDALLTAVTTSSSSSSSSTLYQPVRAWYVALSTVYMAIVACQSVSLVGIHQLKRRQASL